MGPEAKGKSKRRGPGGKTHGKRRSGALIEDWCNLLSPLLAAHLSQQAIQEALEEAAAENKALGPAPRRATIERYTKLVIERWRAERAKRKAGDFDARIQHLSGLAKRMEKAKAWGPLANIQRQLTDLLGVEPAKRHEHTGAGGKPLALATLDLKGATDEELAMLEELASRVVELPSEPAPEEK